MHRAALPALLGLLTLATAPLARAGEAPCPKGDWTPSLPPKFEYHLCRQRTFVPNQDYVAGGVKRTVNGPLLYVQVTLPAGSAPEAGLDRATFLQFAHDRAAKLGATPVGSDDNDLLFEKHDGGHLTLYFSRFYGNPKFVTDVSFVTAEEAPAPQQVVLRSVPPESLATPTQAQTSGAGCTDPPWLVKSLAAYQRSECRFALLDDTDAETFKTAGPSPKVVRLTGPAATVYYTATRTQTRWDNLDTVEVPAFAMRNFAEAANAAGFPESGSDDTGNLVWAHVPTDHGDFWYVIAGTGGNSDAMGGYRLTTIQMGTIPRKTCTTEFYGITFDFDKSTIKPDSKLALEKMLALFTSDLAYAAEIGGHTDNVGHQDYNLKLVGERAGAVKAWLVERGIKESRIKAQGYGDTKPLVPNDTEANRAKNRRVELTREHCVVK